MGNVATKRQGEMMSVDFSKYYTPEQLAEIKRRGEQAGPARLARPRRSGRP